MKTKKILKNQKPIDTDIHLKYRCSEPDCGCEHWLSLKETQTKKFRVVCECGLVFQPKAIKNVKIIFAKKKPQVIVPVKPQTIPKNIEIPKDIQEYCIGKLIGYGFTTNEALTFSARAYTKCQTTNATLLLKYILTNLGELNESN